MKVNNRFTALHAPLIIARSPVPLVEHLAVASLALRVQRKLAEHPSFSLAQIIQHNYYILFESKQTTILERWQLFYATWFV